MEMNQPQQETKGHSDTPLLLAGHSENAVSNHEQTGRSEQMTLEALYRQQEEFMSRQPEATEAGVLVHAIHLTMLQLQLEPIGGKS